MTLADRLARVAQTTDRWVGWFRLPKPLGLAVLIGLREQLRADNLYDTGRGPDDHPPAEDGVASCRDARTLDGTNNDLQYPLMGSLGSRFGRNVPTALTYPEDREHILEPNPRVISQRLLARDSFKPATTLNLLAAAWIQFEVHDWFSHGTVGDNPWQIPVVAPDPWPDPIMTIKRTAPDPSPDASKPPTFVTQDTHWWDGSQIYGNTAGFADGLRTGQLGQVRIDDVGLHPEDLETYLDPHGAIRANFWVGLALLHSLFLREHNAICRELHQHYPQMSDQQLYDKAHLVNSALMAKIHTLEWTPAIIARPTTEAAMRANWFGVLGQRFDDRYGRITPNEVLQGIPGSPTDHDGVPYSLTEEFVAVYRMHPLIPDDYVVRSLRDDRELAHYELPDLAVPHVRERLAQWEADDLFYSMGVAYPGQITLHNFPIHLQDFHRVNDIPIDLAAADILRIRERGVPRYNAFRRMLRLKPAATFEDLTDNPVWAEELRQIYGDVERVDLMVGLYAEPKPPGFGFSDTAFRIFILMASRRLRSDRFFTTDFTPAMYTEAGMAWVHANSMRTVLLRHFPALEPTLRSVTNPFAPWPRTPARPPTRTSPPATTTRRYPPPPGPQPTYVPYSDALEQPGADEDRQIDAIVEALHGNNEWAYKKFHHGLRDAHAKTLAVLRGELTVYPDLPPELAQGLFAQPRSYPVITRLSTTSGVIRSDQIRGVHGLAIKVLDVAGERMLADDDAATQDFLLVTHREFPFADVRAYLRRGMPSAWLLARLSDPGLSAVGALLTRAKPALARVGVALPNAVEIFIEPNTHILGQTFYSAAPIRWGDHVAKFEVEPLSESVRTLTGQPLAADAGYDAYRNQVFDFFATNNAEFELRAQLCTDLARMPIEDATVPWPEELSPHIRVAKLRYNQQNPDSPDRRRFGDDVLSYNSWRGLAAHRPLGPINRLKLKVYEASSTFRHDKNNVRLLEPTAADLPE